MAMLTCIPPGYFGITLILSLNQGRVPFHEITRRNKYHVETDFLFHQHNISEPKLGEANFIPLPAVPCSSESCLRCPPPRKPPTRAKSPKTPPPAGITKTLNEAGLLLGAALEDVLERSRRGKPLPLLGELLALCAARHLQTDNRINFIVLFWRQLRG